MLLYLISMHDLKMLTCVLSCVYHTSPVIQLHMYCVNSTCYFSDLLLNEKYSAYPLHGFLSIALSSGICLCVYFLSSGIYLCVFSFLWNLPLCVFSFFWNIPLCVFSFFSRYLLFMYLVSWLTCFFF